MRDEAHPGRQGFHHACSHSVVRRSDDLFRVGDDAGRDCRVGGCGRGYARGCARGWLTVDWQGAGHGTLGVVLNADGTGKLRRFGNAIAWTLAGTAFQMVIAGGDPATFDGKVTAFGLNSRKHPGTMTNMAGDSGTWYAKHL